MRSAFWCACILFCKKRIKIQKCFLAFVLRFIFSSSVNTCIVHVLFSANLNSTKLINFWNSPKLSVLHRHSNVDHIISFFLFRVCFIVHSAFSTQFSIRSSHDKHLEFLLSLLVLDFLSLFICHFSFFLSQSVLIWLSKVFACQSRYSLQSSGFWVNFATFNSVFYTTFFDFEHTRLLTANSLCTLIAKGLILIRPYFTIIIYDHFHPSFFCHLLWPSLTQFVHFLTEFTVFFFRHVDIGISRTVSSARMLPKQSPKITRNALQIGQKQSFLLAFDKLKNHIGCGNPF